MPRRKRSAAKLKMRIASAESASALFPAPAERERIDDFLTRELMDADQPGGERSSDPPDERGGFQERTR